VPKTLQTSTFKMKSLTVDDILTNDQIESIEASIAEAELTTSAEIRVHLEDECEENVLDHAAFIFEELLMHRTELRNGVLIYVAPGTRKMAVIGDLGIHSKVKAGFWEEVKDHMIREFKADRYETGIKEGIRMVGAELAKHFPRAHDDRNELDNTISRGKKNA
jgi:uncharacterized membrane protein